MMLNVQELTARLSMMADPALQQYAAMHKDDPYVLALAVSEANRRRQVRTAQQGAAGMQPQPTVAEQEVAQMAPGIGALPAPALAGMPAGGIAGEEEQAAPMAGGGLVAFAGGGDVERYQYGGMPPASNVTEFAIPGMVQPSRSFMPQAGAPENQDPILRRMFRDVQLRTARQRAAEAQARIDRGLNYESDREAILAVQALESAAAAPSTATDVGVRGGVAENLSGMDRRLMTSPQSVPQIMAAPAADAKTSAAADTTAPASGGPKPPAAPAAAATPALPGGLGDINAMMTRALAAQRYEDPAKKEVAELGKTLKEGAEGRLKSFDEYMAKTGDIFKGREERIGKRETELTKQKDTNTGLAFLNAGLAIMSTPGGLATAIGKGARVGTEQFASGLEKIRAAQERLDDARDKLDELKVNRADMTFKERQALQADIDKSKAEALKLSIEGTRMAAGVTEKRASDIVGNQVRVGIAQFEQAGAGARAQAQLAATLNSPDRVAFMAALQSTKTQAKPEGDPVAAYQKLMELKREPVSLEKLRSEWLDLDKRMQIQQDYPNVKTLEDYLALRGAGGGDAGFKLVGSRPAP